jgi:16S rRNA C967 or C1407 C5-methylase (RsmB/RsmF family)
MDKEKFVNRVLAMVFYTCACNKEEGIEVLEEALKIAKEKKTVQEIIWWLQKK